MPKSTSALSRRLADLKQHNRKAFISFVTAGDLSLPSSLELMHKLAEHGVDVIELGVPFSDPAADGPEIQASSERALARGVRTSETLQLVRDFRKRDAATPVVLMGYYNPIFNYPEAEFVTACAEAGVNGLIVVDLPFEESNNLRRACSEQGVSLIPLIAPTTSLERAGLSVAAADGFVYYIGVRGITGVNATEAKNIVEHLEGVQQLSPVPVVVGFGVKSAQQVRDLSAISSGVVVGSCLVQQIRLGLEQKLEETEIISRVCSVVDDLRQGLSPQGASE